MDIPYSAHFDDIYFAVEDGLAESRYVFLDKNNLPAGWVGRDRFTICETGFGTGLNFLSAWTLFEQTAAAHQHLHYYSFEKYPLAATEIATYLAHWSGEFGGRLQQLTAAYPLRIGGWHTIRLTPRVTLTLMFDDMNRAIAELDTPVDAWFLDGHAPAKNPAMWSDNLFHHMGRLSTQGARFATFTAAGFVRRGLAAVGFDVAKDRGFGRKRDMSVGVFKGQGAVGKTPSAPLQKIAIIGGGIAGASCAASLTARGADVHLYEQTGVASGGSGNERGLFNPRFAAQQGFESDFYGPAFAHAVSQFRALNDIGYRPCGSMHLLLDDDKRKRLMAVADNWQWHTDHMRVMNADEASEVAGIALRHDALFLPDAGVVCPRVVTTRLAQSATLHPHHVTAIEQVGTGWRVAGDMYDAVILAGGADINRLSQTAFLPVQAIRGQVSVVQTPAALHSLKTNLCYGGYATPDDGGRMIIGSTFQHWLHDTALRDDDHHEVIAKCQSVTPPWGEEAVILGGRASFRCAAKDRVPLVGPLLDATNLYITAAHGSHGLLSAQMGAALLTGYIMHDAQILPRSVATRLSPTRFQR